MNAPVNAKARPAPANRVTIRPESIACTPQERGSMPPDRPHSRFQRFMLGVMGTLRGRRLI